MRNLRRITKSEPLSKRAYREIRQAIFNGQFREGQRITEPELANALGLSRTPVHEAVARLEMDGLVEVQPGAGLVIVYSKQDLEEVYDLRLLLEGYAVRLAAERITEEQLAELERMLESYKDVPLDSHDERAEINRMFHWAIITASGHRRLIRLLEDFRDYFPSRHLMGAYTEGGQRRGQQEHEGILEALRARDGELAERLMRAHVDLARGFVLGRGEDGPKD